MAVSAYGLVIRHRRYGGEFQRYFHELMDSQWFSKDEIEALQTRKLREIVRWAYEQVPYQKRRFDEAGIDPYKVESIEDLAELPIMTSQDLRRLDKELVARGVKGRLYRTYSSGTTGTPTCTYVTADDLRRNAAFLARARAWAGLPVGRHRMATFGGRIVVPAQQARPPFWRYDVFSDNWHFSSYHLSERNLPHYCRQLAKIDPIHIRSYPSAIYTVAFFMRDHSISDIRPRAIVTSAETLLEHQRQVIEEQFACNIHDEYGCNEMAVFATQCEHRSYHICPEYSWVEVRGSSDYSPDQTEGTLTCTSFVNFTVPLIRYRMADAISLSSDRCDCGREMPVIKQICGREDDIVTTPDGRKVGRLDPVFKGTNGIKEAQIVQESPDHITVRVVWAQQETGRQRAIIAFLRNQLQQRLGEAVHIDFEETRQIERTRSGKFRAVISKVPNRQIELIDSEWSS